jgi:hypothetical protein
MKRIFALVIAMLISPPGLAGKERHPLVQPRGTELVLRKVQRVNDLYAEFTGTVEVTGTMMGWWPGGATNTNYKEPEYLLIPDNESKARLPHFLLNDPPYSHSYNIRDITVTNGPAALREAVGSDSLKRLLERRVNHIRVTGKFSLSKYVVGVECDAPWARATVVKSQLPEQLASLGYWPQGGC